MRAIRSGVLNQPVPTDLGGLLLAKPQAFFLCIGNRRSNAHETTSPFLVEIRPLTPTTRHQMSIRLGFQNPNQGTAIPVALYAEGVAFQSPGSRSGVAAKRTLGDVPYSQPYPEGVSQETAFNPKRSVRRFRGRICDKDGETHPGMSRSCDSQLGWRYTV